MHQEHAEVFEQNKMDDDRREENKVSFGHVDPGNK